MVKLEEVEDEELEKAQPGPISEDEDDDFVDTAGKGLWLVTTSTVLVMVPYALAYVEEQQIMEQEKEIRAQERLQNEMTPGVGGAGEPRGAGL
ncbi:MAG: mitochondrial import receptor subunit Tom22 [Ramalina farinacea]|uniref:Mitochondrial import receptor subunit Tom22 n=1 Tax=Ramalina farinacea TaxID=258253 RepID=A0AA43QPG2_9LECA|nr:mitochondrial import receptor subunit Tom22 [Ramalina farinacea]